MTSFIVGKPSSSGKLIVLDGDEQLASGKESRQQYPGQNSFREGNGSAKSSVRSLGSRVGSLPSRPGSQGGPPCSSTPTRQVALPRVRRRESREDYDEVDRDEIESVKASISRENSMLDESFNADSGLPSSSSASFMTQLSEEKENSATPRAEAAHTSGESSSKQPKQGSSSKQPNEEDSSSDSDEEEKKERKAPTDLFMEFLTCLMSKDYPNALKLCKMILIYEPNHPEALKFLPLIQEKMELDEMPDDPEGEEGNADENEDDEEDDDDSDDDDDDDDEDESSDEEDSGSDVDEEEFQQIFRREDSGVASATDDP